LTNSSTFEYIGNYSYNNDNNNYNAVYFIADNAMICIYWHTQYTKWAFKLINIQINKYYANETNKLIKYLHY